jgi:hypothetical protein
MVEHIVLFKVKENASLQTRAAIGQALTGLRHQISGIIDLTFGATFTHERAQGYTHALVVRFANKEALAAYGPHPAHQKAVHEVIRPAVDDVIALDFEI